MRETPTKGGGGRRPPPPFVGAAREARRTYSARAAAAAEAAAEAGAGIVAEETAEAAGANRTKTHHILHAGVFRHRESNGNGPRAWQALKSSFNNDLLFSLNHIHNIYIYIY